MNNLIPMLSLAGEINESRLKKLLDGFCDCGISQFMLYPRSGCKIEYMSDEWHDVCLYCIEFAKMHGMKVWLYDEFNWPSGSCAGRVPLENPDYISSCIDISDGHFRVYKNAIGYKVGDPVPSPTPFVTDLFNKDAVECFISLTHERYYKWFGCYFGSILVGMFTDEPSFVYPCLDGAFPYYDGLEKEYKAETGRDLSSDFEQYAEDKEKSEFLGEYYNLLTEKFRRSYFDTVNEWCENHGIEFTGHLMSDNSLCDSIKASGNELRILDRLSIPGIDNIYTSAEPNSLLSFAFVENTLERRRRPAMAELFALGRCDMPYAKQLQMIYLSSSYGINRYFLAITHLDTSGNYTIYGYYNNYSVDNPNFGAFKLLGKLSENAVAYADKTICTSVSIRFPVRSESRDGLCGNYDKMLIALIRSLCKSQVSWKIVREEDDAHGITIAFHDFCYHDESTGEKFKDAEELTHSISCRVSEKISVTDEGGSKAENILIRTFTDGNFLIFNLDENSSRRQVYICIDGKKYPTVMEKYAILDSVPKGYEVLSEVSEKPVAIYYSPGIFRLSFLADKPFEFTCEEDFDVCLALRNYPKSSEIQIDGKKIKAYRKCDLLTGSFDGLYTKSDAFRLEKGLHTAYCDGADDKPYLPTALLIGDFDPSTGIIKKRYERNENVGIPEFFGSAGVIFTTKIPNISEKLYLEYSCSAYYSQIFIDGEYVGESFDVKPKIEIQDIFKGKSAKIEIRLFSSQSPIFGELCEYEMIHKNPKPWFDGVVPYSKPETICVNDVKFVRVTE